MNPWEVFMNYVMDFLVQVKGVCTIVQGLSIKEVYYGNLVGFFV